MKSSDEVSEYHGLENLAIEFTDKDFQTPTNYKAFCTHVRPMLVEANRDASMPKILCRVQYSENLSTSIHIQTSFALRLNSNLLQQLVMWSFFLAGQSFISLMN